MALTAHTLRELRSELVVLQQQRNAIDTRIKGLDFILSSHSGETASGQDHQRRPRVGALRRRLTEILQVKSGFKAAEVVEHLQREGFQVGGKAALGERVSHELWRLRRLKIVERNRGKYSLATKDVRLVTRNSARSQKAIAHAALVSQPSVSENHEA